MKTLALVLMFSIFAPIAGIAGEPGVRIADQRERDLADLEAALNADLRSKEATTSVATPGSVLRVEKAAPAVEPAPIPVVIVDGPPTASDKAFGVVGEIVKFPFRLIKSGFRVIATTGSGGASLGGSGVNEIATTAADSTGKIIGEE